MTGQKKCEPGCMCGHHTRTSFKKCPKDCSCDRHYVPEERRRRIAETMQREWVEDFRRRRRGYKGYSGFTNRSDSDLVGAHIFPISICLNSISGLKSKGVWTNCHNRRSTASGEKRVRS